MINCIIVDDEQHAIDLLERHIKQTPFLKLLGTFTEPVKALQLIHEKDVDLIFLDVQMPQMNGIEFMQTLGKSNKVILTTAYSSYAMEGFDNEVVDYLLKPIAFPRFIRAAQRALSHVKPNGDAEGDYMFVKTEQKGKLLKINIKDILYVEGLKNYVSFYTVRGERIIALLNLKDLEARLSKSQFARVHKSFIVSIPAILLVEGNTVKINGASHLIPIGNTYREPFMAQLEKKLLTNKGQT